MEPELEKPVRHYYGDTTRIIFIAVGIIMLLSMPAMTGQVGVPLGFIIATIVLLGIAAGLTSPVKPSSLILDVSVSILGLIFFIYTVWFMRSHNIGGFLLFLSQLIAVLFLIASYLSIKSLRGYNARN
ncbi:MAG TPA: hypothetical protein VG982_02670 [Candidatus Paceibacterota bacterium]|jgi:hypothetical protein|nr:hypothetical protein [Candidatus Paceibacterota bacterium]